MFFARRGVAPAISTNMFAVWTMVLSADIQMTNFGDDSFDCDVRLVSRIIYTITYDNNVISIAPLRAVA